MAAMATTRSMAAPAPIRSSAAPGATPTSWTARAIASSRSPPAEFDTVIVTTGVAYALTANIEALRLDGASLVSGIGNALANHITGNAATNVLRGGLGADTIRAGQGHDVVFGDGGADVLFGEEGRDQFRFGAIAESSLAAPDRIADFVAGQDLIDLRFIDGDAAARLTYVAGAPTGARQVGVVAVAPETWRVLVDIDGGGADMAITVDSAIGPRAGWFLL